MIENLTLWINRTLEGGVTNFAKLYTQLSLFKVWSAVRERLQQLKWNLRAIFNLQTSRCKVANYKVYLKLTCFPWHRPDWQYNNSRPRHISHAGTGNPTKSVFFLPPILSSASPMRYHLSSSGQMLPSFIYHSPRHWSLRSLTRFGYCLDWNLFHELPIVETQFRKVRINVNGESGSKYATLAATLTVYSCN